MYDSKIEAPGKTFSFKSQLPGNNLLVKTHIENKNNLFHYLCLASDDNYLYSTDKERKNITDNLIKKFKDLKWKSISTNSLKEDIYQASKEILKDLLKSFVNKDEKEYQLQETKR